MTHYEVEFLGRELCGLDVVTCRFARPTGYEFSAGQWMRLTLETSEGPKTKTFSHCSAPGDAVLELTTRLSGSVFKNALGALTAGATVSIAGPGGQLGLPAGLRRACFLIGGVGITPIRSMLRDAFQHRSSFEDALLLYGNRDETCAPFADEFSEMRDIGVRMVLCYERATESWTGEKGFITADTVRRHITDLEGRLFVVTGPPVMVSAMESVLGDLGIPGESRLIERFGAP
jgi:glycine betaine catabolism B